MANRTAVAAILAKDAQLHLVVVEDWHVFAAVFHQFGCIHACSSSMVLSYA
jgi:hypothetical protein